MAAPKIINTTLDSLIPDDLNANKGTEFGQRLIEKSLRELGAGRSILIDKNNKIIAGNKTIENAAAIGLENVIIVETTGEQIVAVKRKDIDIDSEKGRSLAIADNATAKANLAWDTEALQSITAQWAVKPSDWGVVEAPPAEPPKGPENKKQISTMLYVECRTAERLQSLFEELQDRGFDVKLKD